MSQGPRPEDYPGWPAEATAMKRAANAVRVRELDLANLQIRKQERIIKALRKELKLAHKEISRLKPAADFLEWLRRNYTEG